MGDGKDWRPTPEQLKDFGGGGEPTAPTEQDGGCMKPASSPTDQAARPDPYLVYLDEFFWEWNTPEDAEAFDGL